MKKLIAGISSAVIALALLAVVAQVSANSGCDVTVTAGVGATAIQDAVDAASAGDTICLDGTFTTTSGPGTTSEVATVEVGTSNITIKSASPGVMDGGDGPAFRLADGLSHVTFQGLEIKNRTGFRGGGIEAWDRTTSHINVRNNDLNDNSYSGVLVGSEGGFIHSHWKVENNKVEGNGSIGIELTNCEKCSIKGNDIDGGLYGIVVQARNTVAGSGLTAIGGVHVVDNSIDGAAFYGIYVLSYTGLTGSPFTSVAGASALLRNVSVRGNTVTDTALVDGIRFWAYNPAATAKNSHIRKNTINCLSGKPGIEVLEEGASGDGTVEKVKIGKNTIDSDCSPAITDEQ